MHTVRPGITDPASIVFRHEEEILARAAEPDKEYRDRILPSKLALYEQYLKEQSFVGDLAILVKTIVALAIKRKVGPASRMLDTRSADHE